MLTFTSEEVRQLLHNKFVVIMGDSIQRSVYKDLIRLLQTDSLLTSAQMKAKGELHFENDCLLEGGLLGGLHNGTNYREVRQFHQRHHLVRFYFLTRVYSPYLESILDHLQTGPQPDLVILNSCVWDVSRYGPSSMKKYRTNLEMAFNRLDAALSPSCLVIWNMTMPLGPKVTGGFLIPELQHLSQTLRNDIIEGNFYGATLAGLHLFDVVDLHYHFRFDLGNRVKDGVHWNNVVHRRITHLLLAHVADAWGVIIPEKKIRGDLMQDRKPPMTFNFQPGQLLSHGPSWRFPEDRNTHQPHPDFFAFHDDSLLVPTGGGLNESFSGFTSFEESGLPPFHLDAVALDRFCHFERVDPSFFRYDAENVPPRPGRRRKRAPRGPEPRHNLVMRPQSFYAQDYSPYKRGRGATYERYWS
nr:PREDICTED: PC-esterase domain-containing protein 1A [Anolis carolinensis]|eukprot:XP_003228729.2 PREDICTED: PC-esterase domain-containing protein 1A [Anolis carolinensis]